MINIVEKKKQVRELVAQSSLYKLLGKQESLLKHLDNLPDEIPEEDLPLLSGLQALIETSENDADMRETVDMFLRLDEMKLRRDQDPNAPLEDLIKPTDTR